MLLESFRVKVTVTVCPFLVVFVISNLSFAPSNLAATVSGKANSCGNVSSAVNVVVKSFNEISFEAP